MAANLATAAALLLIVLAAPILEASGSDQAPGTRGPMRLRVRCTEVHVVKAGETRASVARAAGLSDKGLLALNAGIGSAALFPGQWVCIAGVICLSRSGSC
ncbi:hypothetical protein ACUV84_026779 [Puccinellia chinampoensis]